VLVQRYIDEGLALVCHAVDVRGLWRLVKQVQTQQQLLLASCCTAAQQLAMLSTCQMASSEKSK
jgi:hypothetical protein